MGMIVTPAQVDQKLITLSQELDSAQAALDKAEMDYSSAKSLWDLTSARTRLTIQSRALEAGKKITVQERDDEAMVRCQDEMFALNTAEAVVKIARAQIVRIRTQVDIARSIGASVRAALEL